MKRLWTVLTEDPENDEYRTIAFAREQDAKDVAGFLSDQDIQVDVEPLPVFESADEAMESL
ncbi:MAG: hypothetical protein ABEI86_12035 [Halobacteriaceae archaeon]